MIIVENRITNSLKVFTAETFWYNDEQGTLKVRGIADEYSNKAVELKDVKVFMEDHWWGVKLKVYDKNSGVTHG